MIAGRLPLLFASAGAAYAAVIRPRLLRWGATDEEVIRPYPGADLIPDGTRSATNAITVNAPAAKVWPWLVQMGYGTAALVLTSPSVVACGGESTSAPSASLAGAGAGNPLPVSVEIAENDDGFLPRSVTVERGQLVHVTFANQGNVIHNLRIAGPSGQFRRRGQLRPGSASRHAGRKGHRRLVGA